MICLGVHYANFQHDKCNLSELTANNSTLSKVDIINFIEIIGWVYESMKMKKIQNQTSTTPIEWHIVHHHIRKHKIKFKIVFLHFYISHQQSSTQLDYHKTKQRTIHSLLIWIIYMIKTKLFTHKCVQYLVPDGKVLTG